MKKKGVIVGNTVGPSLPKSDLRETDPKKGSYVLGRELLLINVKTVNGQAPDDKGNVEVKIHDGGNSTPGKDGGYYVPTVEQVSETEVEVSFVPQGGENMPQVESVTLTLPRGATGPTGPQGEQGPTGPQGDSYILTDSDKAEITRLVIESLGGNPVYGYVDSNNNIVVSGHLGDGKYSVKYEMEDGSLLSIGNLEIDNTIEYSVVCNLTNCTNTNGVVEIAQGASYTATITPNSGYALESLFVTMGGTDITASAVNGSNISIEEVTGDIVITAVAEQTSDPTNFLDTSSADFETESRISNSGTNGITTGARVSVTNYIKVETGDIIVLANCSSNSISNLSGSRFAVYTGTTHSTRVATSEYSTTNSYMKTLENNKFEVVGNSFAYVRFTIGDYGEDVNKVTIHIQRNGEWL